MSQRYIGLDLGGTNLHLGLVDAEGTVRERLECPTEADRGPDHVLDCMAEAACRVAERGGLGLEEVAAIGIGAPGPLDTSTGRVVFAPNLPGWTDIPVRDHLAEATGRPVRLENDANVAAYGEFRAGAARHVDTMAMLTLGTGVGGGMVLGGKLYRGASDTGAELGHLIVAHGGRTCGCGAKGCLEAYASCTAVVDRTRERLADGAASSLEAEGLTCKDIFDAARSGDELAAGIVEETAGYLAAGITSILHTINPRMVVLTGGMMGAGEMLLGPVRAGVEAMAFERAREVCQIRASALGDDTGIVGAALVAEAWDRTGQPA